MSGPTDARSSETVRARDAATSDAAAIARVARSSWRETYRDIFDAPFIEAFLAQNYSVEALERAIRHAAEREASVFLVAEREGEVVGYLQFGEGARGPELFRIYADPAHFGSGVGSALLGELHRRIAGRVDAYVLDVHSRNERGRAFYDRNGFVVVGGGSTPDCDLTLRRSLRRPPLRFPIETDRLRLRPFTERDAQALHAIYGDAETMRYVGGGRPTADLEQTSRVLRWFIRHQEHHGFSLWAVTEAHGGELIGAAGLIYVAGIGPEVEVAYVFRRDRWGIGYATEAAAACLATGLRDLRLERIIALAYPENRASHHVMEKLGMRPAGRAVEYGVEMVRYAVERSSETPGHDEQ